MEARTSEKGKPSALNAVQRLHVPEGERPLKAPSNRRVGLADRQYTSGSQTGSTIAVFRREAGCSGAQ